MAADAQKIFQDETLKQAAKKELDFVQDELAKANSLLEQVSYFDLKTGLINRSYLKRELNKEIISAFEEISLLKKTPREALDQLQNRMDARWAEDKRTRELVKKALSKKNRKVK